MKLPSWRKNLQRRGGFWRHGNWADLHLERRMPLAIPMLEEMVTALPPLGPETAVCDLACGTGNVSFMLLSAYPTAHVTLLDNDPDLIAIAQDKLLALHQEVFLSYAWGGEREEIVDKLDEAFKQRDIRLVRDKSELGFKGLNVV